MRHGYLILAGLVPLPVSAQAPSLPPLLPESEEIALARSAAPPEISGAADIWVLRRGGHERMVSGTNGAACIVARDHPESLYPICYDAAAVRTVLPIQLREQRMREKGSTEDEIKADIASAVERGELSQPERGALAYMMSPRQVIFASPAGPRVGAWQPHVMVYLPNATSADIGAEQVPGLLGLVEPGSLNTHLLIIVKDWARPPV